MNKVFASLLVFSLFTLSVFAQEENEFTSEKKNQINFVFGYTHIPSAFEDGDREDPVFVPTIGLDYFRTLNEKWVLGMILDLELANYIVEFNREDLERDKALLVGVLAGYKVIEELTIMAGPGLEFEDHKNLFVMRIGAEYEIELGNSWLLLPSIDFDFKQEYTSYGLNVGIGKKF
ncbi:hypothetical protein [Tamlana sp. I1]|uniref:hypothetical protein n=1 Tax=Tamlana sp. I1 TaxID=2762061 RepID=UPI00188FECE9|nr:hypothetical protein [Tamlana sp. I1]